MDHLADNTSIEIHELVKRFDSVDVLRSVSLSIQKGTIFGLIGENGAGKSTLANCIAGQYRPDAGSVKITGKCRMIPQEFRLIPTLTVFENIFLGREISRVGILRKKLMAEHSRKILRRLNCDADPWERIENLGLATRQKIEIAKAFLAKCDVLLMDEPTTVLNRAESRILFEIIRGFRDGGGTVLYISHKLEEVREICDRIGVLRDGVLVWQGTPAEASARELAQKMVGREMTRIFPEKIVVPTDAPEILRVENLSAGQTVRNVSFSLKKGELLGLAGLAGAGRTELAETLCALRKKTGGKIFLMGRECHFRNAAQALSAGLSYLSEDRQGIGLIGDFSVSANATLSSLRQYCKCFFMQPKEIANATEKYVDRFHVKLNTIRQAVRTLSGGNQQKVAIAKGLDTEPVLFVFDEPTRGVDIGARGDIYNLIHELAESGVSCLLISSDLEEVIGNCGRVLVMRNGEIAGEVTGSSVNEEEIMYYATGVKERI